MKTKLQHLILTLLLLAALALPGGARAGTLTVTSTNDDGGSGTLRTLIGASASGGIINFAVTGTITLTNGELGIGRNLTIIGPGSPGITISGNHASRVFNVGGGTVTISNLAIIKGSNVGTNATSSGPAGNGQGGAIFNQATLNLNCCTLTQNTCQGGNATNHVGYSDSAAGGNAYGGAIYNQGTLTMHNCTVYANSSTGGQAGPDVSDNVITGGIGAGGGIWNNQTTFTIVNSTISANSVTGGQGGYGPIMTGGQGGSASGGGVFDSGGGNYRNTIIANDTVTGGSGGLGYVVAGPNGSASAPDVDGTRITSEGHNLVGKTDGSGGWVSSDLTGSIAFPFYPLLGPLQNNGGPTYTLAPQVISATVDNGDNNITNAITTDQRGLPRFSGAQVDIGAVELQQALVTNLAASNLTKTNATLNASIVPGDLTNTWYFQYGTTTSYGSFSPTNTLPPGFTVVATNLVISNLTAGTTHHYQILANDGVSVKAGADLTFTTISAGPTATTLAATSIGTTNATLNASIIPLGGVTAYYFQYGTTPSYGSYTPTNSLAAGSSSVSVSNVLTGLTPGAIYYYQAVAQNSISTNAGAQLTFTNISLPPTIIAASASRVNTRTENLAATVNPDGGQTQVYFKYGTTTSYGSFSQTNPVSGAVNVGVTNSIGGLNANTLYHFAVVAANSGGTNTSGDYTFFTTSTNLVTNTADNGAGSLRNAILFTASGDTIIFAANLSGGASC